MTINFSFVFLFFDLSTSGNDACHRWFFKLKHLFSCKDCFERVGFWFEVARIIPVQRKSMAQKYFREMDNFWSICPEATIKDDSEILWSRDLRFWSSREF